MIKVITIILLLLLSSPAFSQINNPGGGGSGSVSSGTAGMVAGYNATGTAVGPLAAAVSSYQGGNNFNVNVASPYCNPNNLPACTLVNGVYQWNSSGIYASGFLAQTTITTSVTSGTTNIPVTSSAGFNVGQVVCFSLGGTSGNKNFCQLISAIPDSTHITVSTAAALTGALLPLSATSGTSGLQTTIAGATYVNTVWSFGTTTLASSASSGATSINVTNAASYYPGEGILVAGGATSAANLLSTITTVSGNVLTISPAISNSSGVSAGIAVQHDDSLAFNDAVNLASVTQALYVYVPDGYYQLNGNPISAANNIVNFPSLDSIANAPELPESTVTLSGNAPASGLPSYLEVTGAVTAFNGATLATALGTTNFPCSGCRLIGAYDTNTYNDATAIHLNVNNLRFRAYPSPTLSMLVGTYFLYMNAANLSFDTGDSGPTTHPTSSTFALMGAGEGTGGNNELQHMQITGFGTGVLLTQHSELHDIRFDNDYTAVEIDAGTNYGMSIWNLQINGCPVGIYDGANSALTMDIRMINYEHETSPSWVTAVADISDSSNFLLGNLTYDIQPSQSLIITGGTNLNVYRYTNYNNLAGPSGGLVNYSQPQVNGIGAKKFTAVFSAYENDTASNQTIAFPVTYAATPVKSVDSCSAAGLTVTVTNSTTLTVTTPDNTTAYTCYVEVKGP